MAINQPSIPVYDYVPGSSPSVVGEIGDAIGAVTITVWEGEVELVLADNACSEIGDTGRYTWSTVNLPAMERSRHQYHYEMTDGVATADGDFILQRGVEKPVDVPGVPDINEYVAVLS